MGKEELKKALEDCRAVEYGSFVLASGKESDYYVDLKRALTDPAILRMIAIEMSSPVRGADKLAGTALGAIPLVVATALETGIPYVMVRKKAKEYGTGKRIEGIIEEGQKVVVLEDVTTSGKSLLSAVEAINEAGGLVEKVIVVVDRQDGAADLFAEKGLDFIPLLVRDELRGR